MTLPPRATGAMRAEEAQLALRGGVARGGRQDEAHVRPELLCDLRRGGKVILTPSCIFCMENL